MISLICFIVVNLILVVWCFGFVYVCVNCVCVFTYWWECCVIVWLSWFVCVRVGCLAGCLFCFAFYWFVFDLIACWLLCYFVSLPSRFVICAWAFGFCFVNYFGCFGSCCGWMLLVCVSRCLVWLFGLVTFVDFIMVDFAVCKLLGCLWLV